MFESRAKPSVKSSDGMKYGDKVAFGGFLHVVANVDRFGVWLISLEHTDAVPFLAYPNPEEVSDRIGELALRRREDT